MTTKTTTPNGRPTRMNSLISITNESGIIQPIVFTMMRQSYSKIQNRAVICVVDRLQQIFHDMLNRKIERYSDIQDPSIKNEQGLSLRIGFNEFGVSPNEYPDLRKALKMLSIIPVEIPTKGAEGKLYDRYTNLCDVYIPRDAYSRYVVITIDKGVAERLITLDFGYQNLYKSVIVYNCRNKYSQRMYMICTAWSKRGKVVMNTLEFRKLLGIDKLYPEFRHVRQRVLDPAKKELEELAEKGYSDCYFDYRLIFLNNKKKGEPDQLEFTIKKSPLMVTEELASNDETVRNSFCEMLKRHFSFDQATAEKYSRHVTAENYADSIEKLSQIYTFMRDANNNVSNPKRYAMRCLDNYFGDQQMLVFED